MRRTLYPSPRTAVAAMSVILAMSACGRVTQIGRTPGLTEPESSVEFQAMSASGYGIDELPDRPDSAASLWSTSQSSLVADRRASNRGDILTVVIEIDDRAEIQNSTER